MSRGLLRDGCPRRAFRARRRFAWRDARGVARGARAPAARRHLRRCRRGAPDSLEQGGCKPRAQRPCEQSGWVAGARGRASIAAKLLTVHHHAPQASAHAARGHGGGQHARVLDGGGGAAVEEAEMVGQPVAQSVQVRVAAGRLRVMLRLVSQGSVQEGVAGAVAGGGVKESAVRAAGEWALSRCAALRAAWRLAGGSIGVGWRGGDFFKSFFAKSMRASARTWRDVSISPRARAGCLFANTFRNVFANKHSRKNRSRTGR